MLTLHRRPAVASGFVPVVHAGTDLQHLSFGLLRLDGGGRYQVDASEDEVVIVLLRGCFRASGPGFSFDCVGPRRNVFADKASAVYAPPGTRIDIEALQPLEAAVIGSPLRDLGREGASAANGTGRPGTQPGQPVLVTPDAVRVEVRGKPGFEREVHDIVDSRVPALRLIVGETFNRAGQWSSYPPHKHDELVPGVEVPLEEIYYFRVDPPEGFGVQLVYSPDRGFDASYRILDGDVVLLPFGYHPVAAAPGYRLYYLWALAGNERTLRFREDPAHVGVSATS